MAHWVLFSYNGNETVARVILDATFEQIHHFIASEGNQDDEPEWLFEGGMSSCQLIQIPGDTMGLGNSNNLVAWVNDSGETWMRISDLPRWIVDYSEYPEGKIVRDKSSIVDKLDAIVAEDEPTSLKQAVEDFMNNGALTGQPVEGEEPDPDEEYVPYDANGEPKDGYVDPADLDIIDGKKGF